MYFNRLSIIKLKKSSYNMNNTNYKCDLLIIKTLPQENAYIVRYPNGYTQQVCCNEVLESSVVNFNTYYYPKRAENCEAFIYEYTHNERTQEQVKRAYPEYVFKIKLPDVSHIPIRETTVQLPTEQVTLESLDKKVQLILDLIQQQGGSDVQL